MSEDSTTEEYRVVTNEKGERFIEYHGDLYPEGFAPDPNMDARELYIARKKESVWTWTVRIGLLAILVLIIVVIVFAVTK